MSGFKSDYNITMDRFSTNWGDDVISLTEWQSETSQDEHSFTSSPEEIFVNVANNNYDLQPNCLAVDSGTSVNAPAMDIRKIPRPQDAQVDIGAYEYTNDPVLSLDAIYSDKENFRLFPNPVSEASVHIKSSVPISLVKVISVKGDVVFQVSPDTRNVCFQKDFLMKGLYIVHIRNTKGAYSKVLLVN
jgi:hypothetical protein